MSVQLLVELVSKYIKPQSGCNTAEQKKIYLELQVKRQCFGCLPATVSKQKEKNTKDDAGGANMDADDNTA